MPMLHLRLESWYSHEQTFRLEHIAECWKTEYQKILPRRLHTYHLKTDDNEYYSITSQHIVGLLKKKFAALFRYHQNSGKQIVVQASEYVTPSVTEDQLLVICGRIANNEAPGFDGLPNRALKLAVETRPYLPANTFKARLKEGIFLPNGKNKSWCCFPKPVSHLEFEYHTTRYVRWRQ